MSKSGLRMQFPFADLRQDEGKPRNDGKRAEMRKLTTQQQIVIKGLIDAHGSDLEVTHVP